MKTKAFSHLIENGVHLLALANVAIAQPLYDLLCREPDFFVVRDSSKAEVFVLTLIISLLVPAILWSIEVVLAAVHTKIRDLLHFLFVMILVGLALLGGFKHTLDVPASLLVAIAVFGGALFAFCCYRFHAFRSALVWIAPLSLLIPGIFFFHPQIAKAVAAPPPISIQKIKATTPVVLVIFDELPLASLLNSHHEIDQQRYPNFAQLRKDSTWFRNATTVSGETAKSVTAILTGKYPYRKRISGLQDYPHNLFTMLAGNYELKIVEPMIKLGRLNSLVRKKTFRERLVSSLSDLSAIYLNIVLPEEYLGWVPRVDNKWIDFWGSLKKRSRIRRLKENLHHINLFINSIERSDKPALYFLHSMLPHSPWLLLPSGKLYEPEELNLFSEKGQRMDAEKNKHGLEMDYARHLLQVGYVDGVLGKIMKKLKETGLYNRSVILVTADHGICFEPGWPKEARRHVTAKNSSCLLPVPLFIRYPGQKPGTINNNNVQTTDILPTIADLLDIDPPRHIDGVSSIGRSIKRRPLKIAFGRRYEPYKFSKVIEFGPTIQRKEELFGREPSLKWLSILPASHLIGKTIGELTIHTKPIVEGELVSPHVFDRIDLNSAYLPALICGRLFRKEKPGTELSLAISVNGIIRAVTYSFITADHECAFAALVPESSFEQGRNRIEVLLFRSPNLKEASYVALRRDVLFLHNAQLPLFFIQMTDAGPPGKQRLR